MFALLLSSSHEEKSGCLNALNITNEAYANRSYFPKVALRQMSWQGQLSFTWQQPVDWGLSRDGGPV